MINEIVQGIGDIVIADGEGGESHIVALGLEFFDDSGEIRKSVLSLVKEELGDFHRVDKSGYEEKKDFGTYSVDSKSYKSNNYQLDVIQDESYFGASGGTEQIFLSILSGMAGGIAGAITTQIYNIVINDAADYNSNNEKTKTLDEKLEATENILLKRFNASKPLKFTETKDTGKTFKCKVVDSKNQQFSVEVANRNNVLKIDIKTE